MKYITIIFLSLFLLNQPSPDETELELIIFEGSDWCANCRKMEKYILSDSDFIEYLNQENINIIRVDFPQRKKMTKEQEKNNIAIAEKYNFEGVFPTVILSREEPFLFEKLTFKNQDTEEFIHQLSHSIKSLK